MKQLFSLLKSGKNDGEPVAQTLYSGSSQTSEGASAGKDRESQGFPDGGKGSGRSADSLHASSSPSVESSGSTSVKGGEPALSYSEFLQKSVLRSAG